MNFEDSEPDTGYQRNKIQVTHRFREPHLVQGINPAEGTRHGVSLTPPHGDPVGTCHGMDSNA